MKWTLGYSDSIDAEPRERRAAYVPADVQLIYPQGEPINGLEYYNYGDNYIKYAWMEDKYWHFRCETAVGDLPGMTPFVIFKGLDYAYTIRVGGEVLADGEGMFTPVELSLDRYRGKNVKLDVILHPIPKKPGAPVGREEASASCIPAVAYGWDWHPRLVPIGIYDDVLFVNRHAAYIASADIYYDLADDLSSVSGKFVLDIGGEVSDKLNICYRFKDKTGNIAMSCVYAVSAHDGREITLPFYIDKPELWWCAMQGEQSMYELEIELLHGADVWDTYKKRLGFRRVRLVMNAHAWEDAPFPKTQGRTPMTFELNGRKIFAKGTNFVPPEIFTSTLDREKYRAVLELARECNMNVLRMWGGGLVNKESFFELCDELGLMIWQEFPLACNNYQDDDHYLKVLDQESRSIIRRLKYHPSIAVWCGGNELLNSWGGMTIQSHALRLLGSNCYLLDRNTPFMPTSPLYGVGHGNYNAIDADGAEMMSKIIDNEQNMIAFCEFGVPGPSPFEYIKRFTPPEELYDVRLGTSWEWHHALNAWQAPSWLQQEHVESYFGKAGSLEQLVQNGVDLQGEAYKNLFEEMRRKWPHTSAAIHWCFNEPWPTAANNSIINYPAIKKAGFYGVQAALRDQMYSARFRQMKWRAGDEIKVELFALNDLPQAMPGCMLNVYIADETGRPLTEKIAVDAPQIEAASAAMVKACAFTIPSVHKYARLKLVVEAEKKGYGSEYMLIVQ